MYEGFCLATFKQERVYKVVIQQVVHNEFIYKGSLWAGAFANSRGLSQNGYGRRSRTRRILIRLIITIIAIIIILLQIIVIVIMMMMIIIIAIICFPRDPNSNNDDVNEPCSFSNVRS